MSYLQRFAVFTAATAGRRIGSAFQHADGTIAIYFDEPQAAPPTLVLVPELPAVRPAPPIARLTPGGDA
jgi:hypothetical protein